AALVTIESGTITDARIVAGSVGTRPQRLPDAEAMLRGQSANESSAWLAADLIRMEVETTSDAFESEAYKRQLARTVGYRAIVAAIRQATGADGSRHAA
ncbi:MAG: xanthine dehydrogenase family protein subunit M, partial [Chloroflexota bacterium]|nr:xanthine dehydrogenase family protein subunit M [Chloroflexota bacterium]